MAIYAVDAPDGMTYQLEAPDGTPPELVSLKFQRDVYPGILRKKNKPAPPEEKQSSLRQVADVPLQVGKGAVSGVRMISDAFGAGSDTSNTIRGVEDYLGGLLSAKSQKNAQEISRIMNDAKDKGVWDQVVAAVRAIGTAPVDLVSNALGTSAPAIIAGLLAPEAAIGAAVAAGVGAVIGAGSIKGSIYDEVKQELAGKLPPEEVEKRAQLAQQYNGENLDQILLGAGFGTLDAVTGANRILTNVARKTAGKTAIMGGEKEAGKSLLKRTALGAAEEAPLEALQGGQEQLAQNLAIQREGIDRPTWQGVAGQMALEGGAGALAGSVTSGAFGKRPEPIIPPTGTSTAPPPPNAAAGAVVPPAPPPVPGLPSTGGPLATSGSVAQTLAQPPAAVVGNPIAAKQFAQAVQAQQLAAQAGATSSAPQAGPTPIVVPQPKDLFSTSATPIAPAPTQVAPAAPASAPLAPTTLALPQGLAGAKLRYDKTPLVFENDTDKAIYIVQGKNKSKAHEEYRRWLLGQGFTDATIQREGNRVKNRIDSLMRRAPGASTITVPQMRPLGLVFTGQAPSVQPPVASPVAAPAPPAQGQQQAPEILQLIEALKAQKPSVSSAPVVAPPTTAPVVSPALSEQEVLAPQENILVKPPTPFNPTPEVHKTKTLMTRMKAVPKIDVAPMVVELSDVVSSEVPGYEDALQPRDRDQKASDAWIAETAYTDFNPERLIFDPSADRGAPIVNENGHVESGNGRIMVLRTVYGKKDQAFADAYKQELVKNGFDISGMKNPVLVQRRTTPLSKDQVTDFTEEQNDEDKLSRGATEIAISDSRKITLEMLDAIPPGRDYTHPDFLAKMLGKFSKDNRGRLLDKDGNISKEGLQRIRNAVFAKAYGDPETIRRMSEVQDDNIKSITNALLDNAAIFAKLRVEMNKGNISKEFSFEPLLDAINRISEMRSENIKLENYLSQRDAFDTIPPMTEKFMRLFFSEKSRALGREKISRGLHFYASEALKDIGENAEKLGIAKKSSSDILDEAIRVTHGVEVQEGPGLFGEMAPVVRENIQPPTVETAPPLAAITVTGRKRVKLNPVDGFIVRVTFSDGTVSEIQRMDTYTTMGVPGWHDINKTSTQSSFLGNNEGLAIQELLRKKNAEKFAPLDNMQPITAEDIVQKPAKEYDWSKAFDGRVPGRIVYTGENSGLIRGYSIMSGSPVYMALNKRGQHTTHDVASYTGALFSKSELDALREQRERLIDEAKARNDANPNGPFSSGERVVASENFPKDLLGVAKGLLDMLGINSRVYITTVEDAANGRFDGPFAAIESAQLDQQSYGTTRRLSNGDHYIALRIRPRSSANLETLAHEIGHILEKDEWKNTDSATKSAVMAAFDNWSVSNKGTSASQHIEALRPHTTGRMDAMDVARRAPNMKSEELRPYWKSFNEWFADQVARWATSSERPVSVVEKFFARIGAALRGLYSSVSGRKYLPTDAMKAFLDARGPSNISEVVAQDQQSDFFSGASSSMASASGSGSISAQNAALTSAVNGNPQGIVNLPGGPTAQLNSERWSKITGSVREFFDTWYTVDKFPILSEFRNLLFGKIGMSTQKAKDLSGIISKGTQEVQAQTYAYLTTPNADPSSITDEKVRAAAVEVKKEINRTAKEMVDNGYLTADSLAKYYDQYLPRMYLYYEMTGRGIKTSNMGISPREYLKLRNEDFSPEERQLMGEIKNPAFLSYVALSRPQKDMAMADYFDNIVQQTGVKWIADNSLVDYRGHKVTPYWLANEAKTLRSLAELTEKTDPAGAQMMVDRANEMRDVADRAIGSQSEILPENYKRLPDSHRYGALRGAVIQKGIYDDIIGTFVAIPVSEKPFMQALLGDERSTIVKANQLWKMMKVTLNVPSQIRNMVSNAIALNVFGGVPFYRIAPLLLRASKEVSENGTFWQEAQKYGITGGTMSSAELIQMRSTLESYLRKGGGKDMMGAFAAMRIAAGNVIGAASDIYQKTEVLFKMVQFIHEREKGSTPSQAVDAANDALFDYTKVNPNIRFLRNSPIGLPFVTYYYKVLPKLVETAYKHPTRFAPYVALALSIPYLTMSVLDIDSDDYESLRKSLPEYIRNKGSLFIMPWKDEKGRWQYFDLAPFFPWAAFTDPIIQATLRQDPKGGAAEAAKLITPSGPIVTVLAAIATGRDPFTDKEILDPRQTPENKALALMSYVWNQTLPSMLAIDLVNPQNASGAIPRLYNDAFGDGTGLDKRGQPKPEFLANAARLFGANISPLDPVTQRALNINHMLAQIRASESLRAQVAKDQSLVPNKRMQEINSLNEKIKSDYKKLQEYAQETARATSLKK